MSREDLMARQTAEALDTIEKYWDIPHMSCTDFHAAMNMCLGENYYYDAIHEVKRIIFNRNPDLLEQLKELKNEC